MFSKLSVVCVLVSLMVAATLIDARPSRGGRGGDGADSDRDRDRDRARGGRLGGRQTGGADSSSESNENGRRRGRPSSSESVEQPEVQPGDGETPPQDAPFPLQQGQGQGQGGRGRGQQNGRRGEEASRQTGRQQGRRNGRSSSEERQGGLIACSATLADGTSIEGFRPCPTGEQCLSDDAHTAIFTLPSGDVIVNYCSNSDAEAETILEKLTEKSCSSDADCQRNDDTSSASAPREPRTCSLTVQSAAQSLSLCVRPDATATTADDVRKLLGGGRGGRRRDGPRGGSGERRDGPIACQAAVLPAGTAIEGFRPCPTGEQCLSDDAHMAIFTLPSGDAVVVNYCSNSDAEAETLLEELTEDACTSDADCSRDGDDNDRRRGGDRPTRAPREPRTCALTVQSAAQSLSLCVRPDATATTADDVRKLLGGGRGGSKRRRGGSSSTTTTPPPVNPPVNPNEP